MSKWLSNILATFAGTLLALATAFGIAYFFAWRWFNSPIDEPLPPLHPVATALDPGYSTLWYGFVALVVVALIELGVIAYALLRRRGDDGTGEDGGG